MPLVSIKSILIVEDDLINFRVSSKILTKHGELDVKRIENIEEIIKNTQR
jgi:two-component system, cell cycle response regulator DivK